MPLFIGLITGFFKNREKEKLRKAAEEHRAYQEELKQARLERIAAQKELVSERAAVLLWLQPQLNRTAARRGLRKVIFGPGGDLGGITYEKVLSLIQKVRQALVVPTKTALDRVVTVSIGASLLLEGIEALDKLDVIDVPVLHENLTEVLNNLDIIGADDIGATLAEVGIDTVSDVVGDLLLIGGIIKGAYNLSKMGEISEKVETVRASVGTLQDHVAREERLRSQSETLRHCLEERTYQALKWSLIANTAPRYGEGDGRTGRERTNIGFRRSMAALWAAHCASPEEMPA